MYIPYICSLWLHTLEHIIPDHENVDTWIMWTCAPEFLPNESSDVGPWKIPTPPYFMIRTVSFCPSHFTHSFKPGIMDTSCTCRLYYFKIILLIFYNYYSVTGWLNCHLLSLHYFHCSFLVILSNNLFSTKTRWTRKIRRLL